MKTHILFMAGIFTCNISLGQTSAKDFYDKGKNLEKEKKYTEAVTAFKKATALNPQYGDAWFELSWCNNELGEYGEALSAAKKEIAIGTTMTSETYFEAGYACRKLAKYDESVTYLDKAISLNPDYAQAYFNRAYSYYYKKEYAKTVDDLNQYLLLVPDTKDEGLYYDKGWCENEIEKPGEAAKSLSKSVELNPAYKLAWTELGYTYYKLNLNNEAINSYRTASTLYADTAYRPLAGIGDVYYSNLKNYDSAMYYYARAVKFKKDNKIALFRLGWCYNNKGLYSDGVGVLTQAVLIDPADNGIRNELGYSYYKLGQVDNAQSQFRLVINRDSKDELSRYYSGLCYASQKDQVNLKKMIAELEGLHSTKYVDYLKSYVNP